MTAEAPADRLFREILLARQRVYALAGQTPLELIRLGQSGGVYLKREDMSPIHAYKWRGAFNRMSLLSAKERERGVVAVSAGNHAQGVALGAQRLGIDAAIVMPTATPRMKLEAVRAHGAGRVRVIVHGDRYDEAQALAQSLCEDEGRVLIHPYNDYATMGGQGTLADEIVMSGEGPFDVAYLQIGGGGMAAAVACWLRRYYPKIHIVGVEGVDQASMAAAVKAGEPVTLEYVDVFCDGTAVKRAGSLTYPLCAELVDEFITVTNSEVCAAIQVLWEQRRCIPEPSGAMGLAGLLKQEKKWAGKKALAIVCGANMDFGQLAWVAQHAGIGMARRRYYRFHIHEQQGALLDLLQTYLQGIDIIEFQYGKTHPEQAWPVLGVEAAPAQLELLERTLTGHGVEHEIVTGEEDVEFRIIHYEPHLFQLPYFIKLEFPERAGALYDFLQTVSEGANICYFNYVFTGEQVGRALIGFEFPSEQERAAFKKRLDDSGRTYHEISEEAVRRIL